MIHMLCDDFFGSSTCQDEKKFRDVRNCPTVSDCREVCKISSISGQSLYGDIWFCLYWSLFCSIRCLRKYLSLHLCRYSNRLSRKTYDMTYVKRHARKSWFYRLKNLRGDRRPLIQYDLPIRHEEYVNVRRKDPVYDNFTRDHTLLKTMDEIEYRIAHQNSLRTITVFIQSHPEERRDDFFIQQRWQFILDLYDISFLTNMYRDVLAVTKYGRHDLTNLRCGNVIRKLGDIPPWQDASCYLSDVVKEMKKWCSVIHNYFKLNLWIDDYHDMTVLEFVPNLHREDKSQWGTQLELTSWWISSSRHKSLLHQYILHQYIIKTVRGYERTIHNFGKKIIVFGIIHDCEYALAKEITKSQITYHFI